MSNLIDRQQTIDAVAEAMRGLPIVCKDIAEKVIKQLPTIQPDIVRCKDCKHYRHRLCMKASMCVNKSENGFCDWAERREVTE